MSICLVFMLMEDDLEDACNQLADFIVKVDEKTPDPLVASTAIELITEAKAIQTAIGCP